MKDVIPIFIKTVFTIYTTILYMSPFVLLSMGILLFYSFKDSEMHRIELILLCGSWHAFVIGQSQVFHLFLSNFVMLSCTHYS